MKVYEIQFEAGAEPEPHEIQTALFLKANGKDVRFLAPKNQNRVKTPDIAMDGVKWEIKSPISNGARTIEHAFRQAIKQSPNVIFDLRNSKAADSANLARLRYVYRLIRGKKVKNLIVITKEEQKLLDLNKDI